MYYFLAKVLRITKQFNTYLLTSVVIMEDL